MLKEIGRISLEVNECISVVSQCSELALAAIATSMKLHVYRTRNWEKVWTFNQLARTVAWLCNGRVLKVMCKDGHEKYFSIHRGEEVFDFLAFYNSELNVQKVCCVTNMLRTNVSSLEKSFKLKILDTQYDIEISNKNEKIIRYQEINEMINRHYTDIEVKFSDSSKITWKVSGLIPILQFSVRSDKLLDLEVSTTSHSCVAGWITMNSEKRLTVNKLNMTDIKSEFTYITSIGKEFVLIFSTLKMLMELYEVLNSLMAKARRTFKVFVRFFESKWSKIGSSYTIPELFESLFLFGSSLPHHEEVFNDLDMIAKKVNFLNSTISKIIGEMQQTLSDDISPLIMKYQVLKHNLCSYFDDISIISVDASILHKLGILLPHMYRNTLKKVNEVEVISLALRDIFDNQISQVKAYSIEKASLEGYLLQNKLSIENDVLSIASQWVSGEEFRATEFMLPSLLEFKPNLHSLDLSELTSSYEGIVDLMLEVETHFSRRVLNQGLLSKQEFSTSLESPENAYIIFNRESQNKYHVFVMDNGKLYYGNDLGLSNVIFDEVIGNISEMKYVTQSDVEEFILILVCVDHGNTKYNLIRLTGPTLQVQVIDSSNFEEELLALCTSSTSTLAFLGNDGSDARVLSGRYSPFIKRADIQDQCVC